MGKIELKEKCIKIKIKNENNGRSKRNIYKKITEYLKRRKIRNNKHRK